jgi:TM2 domain-containing membrane protein YozV
MVDQIFDAIEGKRRSIIAAYILWFFTGTIGLHRIYLGYRRTGLAMLALGAGGWLVVLVTSWLDAQVTGSALNSTIARVLLAPNTLVQWIGDLALWIVGIWWLVDAVWTYVMVRRRNEQGLIPAALVEPLLGAEAAEKVTRPRLDSDR